MVLPIYRMKIEKRHRHNPYGKSPAPDKAQESFKPFAYLTFLAEQGIFRMGYDNGVADLSDEDRETPSSALLEAVGYFGLSLEQYDAMIESARENIEAMSLLNA